MANLSRNNKERFTSRMEEQLKGLEKSIAALQRENKQLTGENQGLRETINSLEERNYNLEQEVARLKAENESLNNPDIIDLVPFSDISSLDTPTTRPSTGYTEQKEGSIDLTPSRPSTPDFVSTTQEIIDAVRDLMLTSTSVSDMVKEQIGGDVLIVYFQLTDSTNEIYGYSIFDSDALNNSGMLNEIDEISNIQVYRKRSRKELEALSGTNTVTIHIHNAGWVESPMKHVDSGDILLWVRTNKPVNNIKAGVARLFRNKFSSTLRLACRGAICDDTNAKVLDVADMIENAYQDVKHERVVHKKKDVTRPPAMPPVLNTKATFEAYLEKIKPPTHRDNGELLFYQYFNGEPVADDFKFETIVGEDRQAKIVRAARFQEYVDKKARVTTFNRIQLAVAVKNVAVYIMEMVDYFHQRMECRICSQDVIDHDPDFFYGADLGLHEHFTSPTQQLEDLMDHMYDLRIGMVYIDQLGALVLSAIGDAREVIIKTSIGSQFIKCLEGAWDRFGMTMGKHEFFYEYDNFKRENYMKRIQKILKDRVPDVPRGYGQVDRREEKGYIIVEKTLGRYEIDRLYAFTPRCSLRNYYQAAMALGVEDIYAFMKPDRDVWPNPYSVEMEVRTGQMSIRGTNLYLPWYVDGYKLNRPEYRFISQWRTIVRQVADDTIDRMLYENYDVSNLEIPSEPITPEKIFQINIVGTSMRTNFDAFFREVMLRTAQQLNEIYIQDQREPPLSLSKREEQTSMHQYYVFQDVFKAIELSSEPDWSNDRVRESKVELWIVGVPSAFPRRDVVDYGDLVVRSLSPIESDVLARVMHIIHYKKQQEDDFY